MIAPIITPEQIRDLARAAYTAGRARDSHAMNPGAPALADWLDEFDRLERHERQIAKRAVPA